jgi:hypothetical protein
VCSNERFDPEDNHRNRPQGPVALGALLVAGGEAAILLAAVDQPLHALALPIPRPVKRPAPLLGAAPGDRVPNPAPAAVLAQGATAKALISHGAARAHPGPPGPSPFDGPLAEQPRRHGRLVLLAWRQNYRQRLATPLRLEVHLRAEPALAAPEGFRRRVPPFAPAACWWARITVPSR